MTLRKFHLEFRLKVLFLIALRILIVVEPGLFFKASAILGFWLITIWLVLEDILGPLFWWALNKISPRKEEEKA